MFLARESKTHRRKRFEAIVDRLNLEWPDARIVLDHGNPFELVVSVLLAAQCTDARVNEVTPALFARFPTPQAYALATPEEIEPYVQRLGLFRSKARHLAALGRALVAKHGCEVPQTRELLATLPGVGWKTAGVVATYAYNEPAFPVDTHVGRLARRMGLSTQTVPEKVERDLTALLSPEHWGHAHQLFVWLGRRSCQARRPSCDTCPVESLCPRVGV